MTPNDRILIVGGGFGGARVAQDLAKAGFSNVTLVDRKDYFEVTYSTLRTLVTPELGTRARMKYSDLMNSKFIQGELTELRPNEAQLVDGQVLPFDTAVIATGSSYASFPVAKSNDQMTQEGRSAEFEAAHHELENAASVLIIGGGPVGVELAGEIADHYPLKSVTLAQRADRLLDTLKPKASNLAQKFLTDLGVKILLNTRLSKDDEVYRSADVVYVCVGQHPNTGFMTSYFSASLTDRGLIKVDDTFRVEGTDTLFALGDSSTAPGLKLGYLADTQGALLAKNIIAETKGKAAKPYKKPADVALVPVGRCKGFAQLPFMVTTFGPVARMKQKDMFIARQYGNLGVKR